MSQTELLDLVRAAASRKRRAETPGDFDHAVRVGLTVLVALAAFWAFSALIAHALALSTPLLPRATAAIFLLGLSLLAALTSWLNRRTAQCSLTAIAERWDQSLSSGNTITTALDFAALPATPFEAAAVEAGMLEARRGASIAPTPTPRTPLGRRELWLLCAAVSFALAAWWMPLRALRPRTLPPTLPPQQVEGETTTPASTRVARAEEPPAPTPILEANQQSPEVRLPGEPLTARPEGGGTPPTEERHKSVGKPGKGTNTEAVNARQSSQAEGDPTEGQAPTPTRDDKKPTAKKPPKETDRARMIKNAREKEQKTGATSGQAGSGGGAMSPVKSPWDQRDMSSDDPLPENAAEEDVQDEITEDEARGGTQPSMKDRRGATSRDLSISGPGEGGDGRGGPTPQKKARGTASLVLGVPVPDFVRGLLNPGTTKVTHERVEPQASDESPSTPVSAASRNRPEVDIRAETIPAALRSTLRLYFRRLHGAEAP